MGAEEARGMEEWWADKRKREGKERRNRRREKNKDIMDILLFYLS
jgi:hypothetical protein